MHDAHIDLGARRQTVAHQPLAIVRPAGDHHRQLLVVVVQTPQPGHVAVQALRGVRHQVAGAVAHGQLPIGATLHRAGAVAVVPVHGQRVLVGEAAAALRHADRTRLRVVFDVAQGDLALVGDVWTDGEELGLGGDQIGNVLGAERVNLRLKWKVYLGIPAQLNDKQSQQFI